MNFDPILGKSLSELIELISNGQLAAARRRAAHLLERYPEQTEVWRLAAICALQMGDLEDAQKNLDEALKLSPIPSKRCATWPVSIPPPADSTKPKMHCAARSPCRRRMRLR